MALESVAPGGATSDESHAVGRFDGAAGTRGTQRAALATHGVALDRPWRARPTGTLSSHNPVGTIDGVAIATLLVGAPRSVRSSAGGGRA
jgi:hypothetical protein